MGRHKRYSAAAALELVGTATEGVWDVVTQPPNIYSLTIVLKNSTVAALGLVFRDYALAYGARGMLSDAMHRAADAMHRIAVSGVTEGANILTLSDDTGTVLTIDAKHVVSVSLTDKLESLALERDMALMNAHSHKDLVQMASSDPQLVSGSEARN